MVSVVIPAYNAEKDIGQCIKSVLGQSYTDFELIIVDDCSTDKTPQIIASYAKKDSRIKTFRNERRMQQGYSRNKAAEAAKGEILAFIDSDCLAQQNWLEELIAPMEKDGFSACQGINYLGLRNGFWSRLESIRVSQYRGFDTKNAAIERADFISLGGFDTSTSPMEDVDFGRRFENMGGKLTFSNAQVRHSFLNNPLKNLKKFLDKAYLMYIYLNKYEREDLKKKGITLFSVKWYLVCLRWAVTTEPYLHFSQDCSNLMKKISKIYWKVFNIFLFTKIFWISVWERVKNKRNYLLGEVGAVFLWNKLPFLPLLLFKDIRLSKPILNHKDKTANRQLNFKEFNEHKTILETYPTNIYVELTKNCNSRCIMCTKETNKYNPEWNMSLDLFKKIADTLFPYADYIGLNGFGESTILKDFEKFVDYTLRFDVPLHLITNLVVKNDSLWEHLVKNGVQIGISFDGANKRTFEFIRSGADFDRVICNLKLLVNNATRFNKPVKNIYLIVCVQGHNLEELPQIVRLANNLGLQKIMFSPVILPEGDPNNLVFHQKLVYDKARESLSLAKRYGIEIIFSSSLGNKKMDEELGLRPFKKCTHPWSFVQITYAGGVSVCNNLCSHPIILGNLQKSDFSKIWNNCSYQLFRKTMGTKFMYRWCDWCHKNRFYFW